MAKIWKMAHGLAALALATDDVAILIAMPWGDLKVDDGFFFSFFFLHLASFSEVLHLAS